jgi:hypothetical protein
LLVLFRLGPHRFALRAHLVIEICEAPESLGARGVFVHRGHEIPIVDLRARFDLPDTAPAGAVIVARAAETSASLALLVDNVDAVLPTGTEAVFDLPEPLLPYLGADLEGLCLLARETAESTGESSPEVLALLGPGALRCADETRRAGDLP